MENREQQEKKFSFGKFHDKNYKLLLLIPIILLLFSLTYMGVFYSKNQDFIYRDISLTGGTSVTIFEKIDAVELRQDLLGKFEDISTREIYDLITREQKAVIIETKADRDITKQTLEEYLGYELNDENSSFEFTGAVLSESFFRQLLLAIIYAFSFMGVVVFFIFSKKTKVKLVVLSLSLLSPILFISRLITINFAMSLSLITLAASFYFYIKHNIPSFAVIISAFADILMTLAVVNILGMKMSSAGIVAFLMLIGYSVDTDILLTTRILKREEDSLNKRIFGAFKTGITMTLTSLLAITFALIVVRSFSVILTQIFTILVIGLGFDILNTWITNASILKWYVKKKK